MNRHPSARAKLDPLTSLRAFATLAVLVHHFVPVYLPQYSSKWLWKTFVGEGFAGVTLFFVLSGFVLTYNYADTFRRLTRSGLRDFYVARFARVYPLFLLAFCIMLPLCSGPSPGKPDQRKGPLYNLTLTHTFVSDSEVYFAFNAPSWSVSVEAFFYLTFPLLLFTLLSCRVTTPLRAGALVVVLALAWFMVAWRYAYDPKLHWHCYICPLSRFFDFGIGVGCGIFFLKQQARPWGTRTATCLELGSVGLLAATILASPPVTYGVRLGPYYTLPMALLILVFAANRGVISWALCRAPFRVLGEASYAIYLLHWPIMEAFSRYRESGGLKDLAGWKCILLLAITTFSVSVLVHYTFERPMRSLIRNRLASRPRVVRLRFVSRTNKVELPATVEPVRRAA
jgi:peptidoglycan/LPS O-acetylase OafA/YrhL